MDKLLSIQEAAEFLGVHPETLRRWDREGVLQAIKVNERGDRRYRYEDLLRFRSGIKVEEYKGYTITPHNIDFEIVPGTLTRIASFIVTRGEVGAGFAFAEGMLNRMSHPHLKDEDLLEEARNIIKSLIDNNKIEHLEEYTFELHSSNFLQVNNPKWWIKSLRRLNG